MSARAPKPIIERAKLWSAGVHRPTWHTFVETRECEIESTPSGLSYKGNASSEPVPGQERAPVPCWEFVYACEESGAERRWGIQGRTVLG